mmetsp:Transcript_36060/g.55379  ORF Transcript_36060/g.55379 Transcript_36060/m.55379 type:complete len:241 (-) Transcript_36060:793-1515(-)
MANMYGYSDYNGPFGEGLVVNDAEEEDEEQDPLRPGLWMEGDSLAPPCGTSIGLVHQLLSFASVNKDDVLYDLGCGDGRVCLEAHAKYQCSWVVGVDIEVDLIERFNTLRLQLPNPENIFAVHDDLRNVLSKLLAKATEIHGTKVGKEEENLVSSGTSKESNLPLPTIIILYLLPEAISEIEDDLIALLRMIPAMRILCNTWGLSKAKPTSFAEAEIENEDGLSNISMRLYTEESLLRVE